MMAMDQGRHLGSYSVPFKLSRAQRLVDKCVALASAPDAGDPWGFFHNEYG